jgi:hypothetical protein
MGTGELTPYAENRALPRIYSSMEETGIVEI